MPSAGTHGELIFFTDDTSFCLCGTFVHYLNSEWKFYTVHIFIFIIALV